MVSGIKGTGCWVSHDRFWGRGLCGWSKSIKGPYPIWFQVQSLWCFLDGEYNIAALSNKTDGSIKRTCAIMNYTDIWTATLATEIRYSRNHDILRTVGFVSLLAAARNLVIGWVNVFFWTAIMALDQYVLYEVRNIRKGGVLFLAPPCATWVFLTLDTF